MPRRSRLTLIASLLAAACLGAGGGAVAYATLSDGDTVVKQVTVKQSEAVASFLHGVAYRIASKARRGARLRREH